MREDKGVPLSSLDLHTLNRATKVLSASPPFDYEPFCRLDVVNCSLNADFPRSVASNASNHPISILSRLGVGFITISPTDIDTASEKANSHQRRIRYWLVHPYQVMNRCVAESLDEILPVNCRPPHSKL